MSIILARLRERASGVVVEATLTERLGGVVDVVLRCDTQVRRFERQSAARAVETVSLAVAALLAEDDFELVDDGAG